MTNLEIVKKLVLIKQSLQRRNGEYCNDVLPDKGQKILEDLIKELLEELDVTELTSLKEGLNDDK